MTDTTTPPRMPNPMPPHTPSIEETGKKSLESFYESPLAAFLLPSPPRLLPEDYGLQCTNNFTDQNNKMRCTNEAIDIWRMRNGILIWARCEECLLERVDLSRYRYETATDIGIREYGDLDRFQKET